MFVYFFDSRLFQPPAFICFCCHPLSLYPWCFFAACHPHQHPPQMQQALSSAESPWVVEGLPLSLLDTLYNKLGGIPVELPPINLPQASDGVPGLVAAGGGAVVVGQMSTVERAELALQLQDRWAGGCETDVCAPCAGAEPGSTRCPCTTDSLTYFAHLLASLMTCPLPPCRFLPRSSLPTTQ